MGPWQCNRSRRAPLAPPDPNNAATLGVCPDVIKLMHTSIDSPYRLSPANPNHDDDARAGPHAVYPPVRPWYGGSMFGLFLQEPGLCILNTFKT